MRVFAYSGTSRKEASNTFKVIQALLNRLEHDSVEKIEYQIYHPENTSSINCMGCTSCFKGKTCPLDKMDDMPIIKQAMLDADVIIVGSPVFLHHVSGTVKTFIDRVSYWAHLLKLTGKVGLSVSTSSTNGNEYVDYYLDKFHLYQGTHAIKPLSLPIELLDQSEVDEMIQETSQEIITTHQNLKYMNPTQKQEIAFQMFKNMYLAQEGKTSESRYWIENGLTEFDTFRKFRDAVLKKEQIKKNISQLY